MANKMFLKSWQLIVLALAIFITFMMIQQGHPPEFYDKFGLVVFAFVAGLGYWMLITRKETPDNAAFLLFIIAILGLVVDAYNVFGGGR